MALRSTTSVFAQPADEPLTSNRPGVGDSEALVARRALQVETGVHWQEAPPGEEAKWTQTWGQLTVRFGLGRRVELFTGWDGLSLDRVAAEDGSSSLVAGGNDLRFGAKFGLLDESQHPLTLTVAPAWSVPIGADEFTSGSNDPSLRFLWARSLPADWSVSGNLVLTRTSDDAGRYWDNAVTFTVARAVGEKMSLFVEGVNVLLAERGDVWTVDGGMGWTRGADWQWDISAGDTFFRNGSAWFVSAGVTRRFRRN
jgi:hypothetical protein